MLHPAVACALALGSSSLLSTQTESAFDRADAVLQTLHEAHPDHAFGWAVVRRDGTTSVGTIGRLDERQPFERWARVPLGQITGTLLEFALARAADDGAFDWKGELGSVLRNLPEAMLDDAIGEFHSGGETEIPCYFRFVASVDDARPLDAVLDANLFVLERYERKTGAAMLRTAIFQRLLEVSTERPWASWVRDLAEELDMDSLRDATTDDRDEARTVRGLHADGRPYPVRFAEVPSWGNAIASLDDVARLARRCLVEGLPDPRTLDDFVETPLTGGFKPHHDEARGMETQVLTSTSCGTVLHLEIVPERDLALVVFGNHGEWSVSLDPDRFFRERSGWGSTLRDALLEDVGAPQSAIQPAAVGGRAGGAGGRTRPRYPEDPLRAEVVLDGIETTLELQVRGRRIDFSIDGIESLGRPKTRFRWKSIEASMDLAPGVDGLQRVLWATVTQTAAGDELVGAVAIEKGTEDGVAIERLPQWVRFRARGDGVK